LNHVDWFAESLGSGILNICRNFSLELALNPQELFCNT
jgi:hypothetical protein